MKRIKVVILGGGFGGLYAALYLDKTLARRADVEVTLISRENFFLFTPMLHEVASGDLHPGDIVNPIRRIIRHIKFVAAEVQAIDLSARCVRCVGGVARLTLGFEFDHLLVALGSETNFFDLPGVSEWAVTMKSLIDAAMLRNRILALLEEASLHTDPAVRRRLLTFVTAGGGFSGVETTGAINDFVREAVRYYPELTEDLIRVTIVHGGEFLLPELGEKLGRYAERKLCERKVEVLKGVHVASYDGSLVTLADGKSIPAATLIWTAGIKTSPAIADLPCRKERGRLAVNEFLAVPEHPGLWAVGDCAAVPDARTGKSHPPTAQHGLREAQVAARNIEAAILGRPLRPFTFKMLGQLATIGRRTGVAMIFGVKFSGLLAWLMWRTIYLLKLPRLSKKLRVMTDWTLDLLFARDLEQMLTLRDVEAMADLAARIRAARATGTRPTIPPAAERLSNPGGLDAPAKPRGAQG
ncbi:MAG: Pyridine nucleotide-disulfide oxidoreductase, FAD/NAD(P)-binding domain protein [Pedosphaera sp.]|nr:Pyridine nucleotide-disulfide oxidoreductase, FAD/NAD(P)-binding domain protein [Pedosphaera sp.]